jgi:hypothetical protein
VECKYNTILSKLLNALERKGCRKRKGKAKSGKEQQKRERSDRKWKGAA